MKSLDDILPSIMPYAPGCALPTAYFAIRQAAIEFCERTRIWRFDDDFQVTTDDPDDLLAPYGAVVHEIEAAWFGDRKLIPMTTAWLDANANGWRTGSISGEPTYITQTDPNTIRIVPRQAGTMRLSLLLKPSQDADELPDFIIDQYRETIAHGALARILLIPNQSFTNVDMGSGFGMSFQTKLNALLSKGATGQQRAALRTRASFI